MKKFIALFSSILMVISLAACGAPAELPSSESPASENPSSEAPSGETEKPNLLEQIKAEGKITVATSPDYPPYEFEDLTKTGQEAIVGADITLAKYIAEKLEVELEILPMGFDAVLAAIGEGRADFALAGMVPKEERKTIMDFSEIYYNDGDQVLVIMADQAETYKTLADFAGQKIAAQNGTLQYDLVTTQTPDAQCEVVGQINDAILMLKTGKVAAVAMASVPAENYAANYPELAVCAEKFEYSALGVVAGVVKDQPELLAALNEILAEVEKSGVYYEWIDEANALASSLK